MAGGRDGPGLRLAADAGAGLHAVGGAGGGGGHGPVTESMAGGQDGSGLRLAADAGTGLHAVGGAGGRSGHGPRAEIMDVDGHIAHVIEPGLSVCEAVVGRQGVVALLGGHAIQFAAGGVAEAAAGDIEAGQSIQHSRAVLHEAAVSGGVDAQSRQSHDDLGTAFAIHAAPAGEAAVIALQGGQGLQGLIHRGPHGLVGLIVGSQSLDGHSGHIRVSLVRTEVPTAVGELGVQDDLDQLLTGHIAGSGIVVAVQGNEGPDGAVDALLLHVGHAVHALEQIMAAHVGHVLADSRQGQDDAGVVGDFRPVQTLIGVGLGLHIVDHIVIVPGGHGAAAAGQADGHPLAAGGADAGGAEAGDVVTGGLIDDVQAGNQSITTQLSQFLHSCQQLVRIAHLCFLLVAESIISSLGSVHGIGVVQGHIIADGVDLLLHMLHRVLEYPRHFCQNIFHLFQFSRRQTCFLCLCKRIKRFLCCGHSVLVPECQLISFRQLAKDVSLKGIHSCKFRDGLFAAFQLRQVSHLFSLGLGQCPISRTGRSDCIRILFVSVVCDGIRQCHDQLVHRIRICIFVYNMQGIPCAIAILGITLLVVHTEPSLSAAAHIDGVAGLHRDGLGALEEVHALRSVRHFLVEEGLDLEVLVGRSGGQLNVAVISVNDQRVVILCAGSAGLKLLLKLSALYQQGFERGIRIAPAATQISAVTIEGEHNADHIAIGQLAALYGIGAEALVGKPVIQRTHPAGGGTAVKFLQPIDAGDIVSLKALAGSLYGFQSRLHAGHHRAVLRQVHPGIYQGAVPGSAVLLGVGGVLHNDLCLAVAGSRLAHSHHSSLIRLFHSSLILGRRYSRHTLFVGAFRLAAQGIAQRLQPLESKLSKALQGQISVGLGNQLVVSKRRIRQRLIIAYQRFLIVRQCIIGRLGRVNGALAVLGHRPNGFDLLDNSVCRCMVLQELLVGRLGLRERLGVAHQCLLSIRQRVIGRLGRVDGVLAVQGHSADGRDLLDNSVSRRLVLYDLQCVIEALAHRIGTVLEHLHQLVSGLSRADNRLIAAAMQAPGQEVVSAAVRLLHLIDRVGNGSGFARARNGADIEAILHYAALRGEQRRNGSNAGCAAGCVRSRNRARIAAADNDGGVPGHSCIAHHSAGQPHNARGTGSGGNICLVQAV